MKIAEIFDSTKSWAAVRGIELHKFDALVKDYHSTQEFIETHTYLTKLTRHSTSSPSPFTGTVNRVVKQFIDDAVNHLNNLKELGVDDPDIVKQQVQIADMINNLNKY